MAPMSLPPPSSPAGGGEASGSGEAVVVTGEGGGGEGNGGEGGGECDSATTCDVTETRSKAAVEPASPVFRKPMASVLPTSGSPTANVLLTLTLVQIEGHPLRPMDLSDARDVGALAFDRLAHAAAPVIVSHVRVAIRLLPKVWVPGNQLVAVGAEEHRRPVTADAGNVVEARVAVLVAVRSTRVAGVVRGTAALP